MQSGTRLPFCCSKMNWWMISAGQKQHENKHGWTQNTTPVRCLCYSYQIRWITKLWLYYRLLGSTCHLAPTAKVKEAIKHDLKQPAVVLDVRTTRYVKNSCGHANNPIQFMIRRQSHRHPSFHVHRNILICVHRQILTSVINKPGGALKSSHLLTERRARRTHLTSCLWQEAPAGWKSRSSTTVCFRANDLKRDHVNIVFLHNLNTFPKPDFWLWPPESSSQNFSWCFCAVQRAG